jgi:hypothetical protein
MMSHKAGAKYGMAVMPSLSPAVEGGDEEDAVAGAGDEGRCGRQAQLAAEPGAAKAGEGLEVEEAEVVATGGVERGADLAASV